MGSWYEFGCGKCGYTVEVSGGPDVGMSSRTVTISCATCKRLRDVVISEEPWKDPPDPVPLHPKCPSSRTRKHATTLWRDPGPCPKCGTRMHHLGGMTLGTDPHASMMSACRDSRRPPHEGALRPGHYSRTCCV